MTKEVKEGMRTVYNQIKNINEDTKYMRKN